MMMQQDLFIHASYEKENFLLSTDSAAIIILCYCVLTSPASILYLLNFRDQSFHVKYLFFLHSLSSGLPKPPHVKAMFEGQDGLLAGMGPGKVC